MENDTMKIDSRPLAAFLLTSLLAIHAWGSDWTTGMPYAYDGSGNVVQIGSDYHLYDAAGRLVQSDTNAVTRNYEYDAFGNRTTCLQPGTNCQYGYTISPTTNRINGATYDNAGNVEIFDGHTYTHDATNMQTRDIVGATAREYVYAADGERIAVYSVGGTWRWTVRDTAGRVLRELTSTNGPNGAMGTESWTWSKDFVWRDGALLASRQVEPGVSSPTTYFYHVDHLGTPRRITDGSDRTVGIHDYYAFGPEKSGGTNEPSLTRMKYTGHERDDTLDYMHARYYSPAMGRFLSIDPVLDVKGNLPSPQGWNRMAYVRNSPLRYTDPTGKYLCEGSARDCLTIKRGWQRLNAAAEALPRGSAERAAVEAAIARLGRPDVDNGVTVTIGRGMIHGNAGGATLTTHTAAVGPTGHTSQLGVDLNAIAAFTGGRNSAAFGPEVAAALGHEAQHDIDQRRLGRMLQFQDELWASETRAYTLDAHIYRGLNFESAWGFWTRAGGYNHQAIQDAVAQSVYEWLAQYLQQ